MTFDKFVNILVTSRVIAPEAISDPDKQGGAVVGQPNRRPGRRRDGCIPGSRG